MGKVCSWSGDDIEVCKCRGCTKKQLVEGFATLTPPSLDAVGIDTNAHVGKMSIINYPSPNLPQTDEKLRYDLIPTHALEELALAYTIGARKHKLAPAVDTTTEDDEFAAIMRHLMAYRKGLRRDPEGHHHLAAVSARCFKLIEREFNGREAKMVTGDN